MANILPVSDLRNYNEVLKNCHKGEPVYLTKNGRGRFVVMDIEDYERERYGAVPWTRELRYV